jgi:hypothetical protein
VTALLYDRVWETTTTTGTGSYTLDGAKSDEHRAFGDVLADNDYVEYFVRDSDASNWERVWGQYDAGNNTLTRNLIESSTGSLIDWGSGTKEIYIAPPAKSLNDDRGIVVATSRPAWVRANTLWLDTDSTPAGVLKQYDGTNDLEAVPYGGGVCVATSRPSWLPANRLWIDSDASPVTLYWYDGTGDRAIGVLSGNVFYPGAAAGQYRFPATQNASADANTLDDYEEGSWTPALSFLTPGNLSIAYSSQTGNYTKVGRIVTADFLIQTSTFTHTTASSSAIITGLPFTVANDAGFPVGALQWQGITKAGYTNAYVVPSQNTTQMFIGMSGSGQSAATIVASDMPSGGTVLLRGSVTYRVS